MEHSGARLRISRRRRPGYFGYGGGWMYGLGYGDREDERDDLTVTDTLGEQFTGDGGDGGGDGGGE